jgi:2-polyprenyl-3-methyl-5-hydroxy-6-metoxy-1,4-benzoquinol methylase
VLEHLPDVKLVLDPFVSRLKPGGALFFQVPLLRNDYLVNTHYTFFGEPAARAACHRLGLAVAGVWYDEAKDLLTCIARRPLAAGA